MILPVFSPLVCHCDIRDLSIQDDTTKVSKRQQLVQYMIYVCLNDIPNNLIFIKYYDQADYDRCFHFISFAFSFSFLLSNVFSNFANDIDSNK